ncbi:hypothetical protein B0J13DRAFT_525936 [Dactylonectria estremocensis]|uniref:Uncharacterized protein n=1 Tax=Dactylonectria estremocensis TaxID=1079267 RepID=A0A9P9EV90_9HYPO|nr:hypothetical protein B0J13DRAFT_525936 [Dactylonectria estremocensis]
MEALSRPPPIGGAATMKRAFARLDCTELAVANADSMDDSDQRTARFPHLFAGPDRKGLQGPDAGLIAWQAEKKRIVPLLSRLQDRQAAKNCHSTSLAGPLNKETPCCVAKTKGTRGPARGQDWLKGHARHDGTLHLGSTTPQPTVAGAANSFSPPVFLPHQQRIGAGFWHAQQGPVFEARTRARPEMGTIKVANRTPEVEQKGSAMQETETEMKTLTVALAKAVG